MTYYVNWLLLSGKAGNNYSKEPVNDEDFPTMQEAAMLAQGTGHRNQSGTTAGDWFCLSCGITFWHSQIKKNELFKLLGICLFLIWLFNGIMINIILNYSNL